MPGVPRGCAHYSASWLRHDFVNCTPSSNTVLDSDPPESVASAVLSMRIAPTVGVCSDFHVCCFPCLAPITALQKVLQFQSRGTLTATSVTLGGVGLPLHPMGEVDSGLSPGVLTPLWVDWDEVMLESWLLARLRHSLNWPWQCAQARTGVPRGL